MERFVIFCMAVTKKKKGVLPKSALEGDPTIRPGGGEGGEKTGREGGFSCHAKRKKGRPMRFVFGGKRREESSPSRFQSEKEEGDAESSMGTSSLLSAKLRGGEGGT